MLILEDVQKNPEELPIVVDPPFTRRVVCIADSLPASRHELTLLLNAGLVIRKCRAPVSHQGGETPGQFPKLVHRQCTPLSDSGSCLIPLET